MDIIGNNMVNPKHEQGVKKYPISPVPVPVMGEIGVAMLEGSLKL